MKIQHENLTVRQAESADAKQLTAWWNDGAVMAHAGFPGGLGTTEEEVIEIIKKFKETESNPGKLIGLTAKEVGNRFDKSKIAALVKQV